MPQITAVITALRPKHWVKNIFVFAPAVFGHRILNSADLLSTAAVFGLFCMLSSAIYLINDIADREKDRLHPVKRMRPIAAGSLQVGSAVVLALLLGGTALAGALWLNIEFAQIALGYLVLNLAYSFFLKNVVILDVMVVSSGFLLRVWAGAVAIGVVMSHWLVLCTALIALFLGFVKRRQEISTYTESTDQRPILSEYSLPFLDQLIAILTSTTLLAYMLYAFSPEVAEKLGTRWMGLTLPFVLYGMFRYLYLVHQRGEGESPTSIVLKDKPLMLAVFLWGLTVLAVLYQFGQ
jgi:4-hydroxybenzoate polyprenyltransferase